jgi:hypothetical protein
MRCAKAGPTTTTTKSAHGEGCTRPTRVWARGRETHHWLAISRAASPSSECSVAAIGCAFRGTSPSSSTHDGAHWVRVTCTKPHASTDTRHTHNTAQHSTNTTQHTTCARKTRAHTHTHITGTGTWRTHSHTTHVCAHTHTCLAQQRPCILHMCQLTRMARLLHSGARHSQRDTLGSSANTRQHTCEHIY